MAFPILGAGDSSAAGYDIENSLRFYSGDAPKLSRTPGSAGNRKIYTISAWIKRSGLGSQNIFGTPSEGDTLYFDGYRIRFFQNGSSSSYLGTNRFFRDVSAWYHIVCAVDTNQNTAANRVKLYVNGSQYTWDASTTYPAEDYEGDINNTADSHMVSNGHHNSPMDAYVADFYFIDGTQYAASDFGETDEDSGIWKPKDAKDDLTFGTNGFFLEFKQSGTGTNSSGMGADTSGNDNHLAVTNLTAIDQCTDTPTNNFATINSRIGHRTTYQNESEGALKPRVTGTSITSAVATMAAAAGKWYYEVKVSAVSSYNYGYLGWCTDAVNFGSNDRPNAQNGVILKTERGDERVLLNNATQSTIDQGNPNYATGVFIGLFADLDNGNFYWLRNGSLIASLTGETSWYAGKMVMPYNSLHNQSNPGGIDLDWNFGNPTHTISSGNSDPNSYGNFEYTTTYSSVDYYAWCTKNLAKFGG